MEISERDTQILNTGRLLRLEAHVLLPLLNEKREAAIVKILQHYRAGKLDLIAHGAAELCVAEDMIQTIKNKIKAAEAVERKL